MTSESIERPKLSVVAQFDDMCRFSNSLVSIEENELIRLIRNAEDNRIKWLSSERELIISNAKIHQLEETNKTLEANLKHVRFGFAKEVQNREELMKQRNAFKNQLNAIKEFVLEDPTANPNQETRDKVLSYLNLNRLETVNEEKPSSDSFDGLEYDATEEDILSESLNPMNSSRKRRISRKSTECQPNAANISSKRNSGGFQSNTDNCRLAQEENFEIDDGMYASVHKRNRSYSEAIPEKISTVDPNPVETEFVSTPVNVTNRRFKPFSMSSPQMKTSNMQMFRNMTPQGVSPMSGSNLFEDRKHNLHQKKAFKPLYCGPCGKAIGFCGNCFCCVDCRAICHISCKDQLPLPCIPFRKPNGKSSQMVLVADFAPQTRPMIPALIIHCCNEIEKRGLKEEGIYRISGSNKDIRELKDKILNSKAGIPALGKYEIHVLCGVVKQFLRDLDEPLVTRILWRDFVRASDQEDPEEENILLMKTVAGLPTANRDTLAFLMAHLIRIAETPENLMDRKSLAKIFGPTIVGYSMIEPPINELLSENPKQIKVMEALLKIPEESWNEIMSSATLHTPNSYGSPDRRPSVGTRLFGDVVKRGTLTPQRNVSAPKGALTLRPLF